MQPVLSVKFGVDRARDNVSPIIGSPDFATFTYGSQRAVSVVKPGLVTATFLCRRLDDSQAGNVSSNLLGDTGIGSISVPLSLET